MTNETPIQTHQMYDKYTFKNIYLAGKIERDDWRHDIVPGLQEASPWKSDCGDFSGIERHWPHLINAIEGIFTYTGPYFVDASHGGLHGEDTHGCGGKDRQVLEKVDDTPHGYTEVDMPSKIVQQCRAAIARSDLIFAWIDDLTCYGTLVELGYAKALGKLLWIAGPKRYRDLWLLYEMADETFFFQKKAVTALRWMIKTRGPKYYRFDSPIEQAFWNSWFALQEQCSYSQHLIPQYRIGRYFVDFAHVDSKTAIELDGHATHSSPDAIAYDRKRQREREDLGWHVIRFGGKEIHLDVKVCALEASQIIYKHQKEIVEKRYGKSL